MSARFIREAAAALLQLAKSTSDAKMAAALIEKAADIKERIGDVPRRQPEEDERKLTDWQAKNPRPNAAEQGDGD